MNFFISIGIGLCLGNSIGLFINGDKKAVLGIVGATIAFVANTLRILIGK